MLTAQPREENYDFYAHMLFVLALTSEIAFLNSVQTLRKYDKEQVKKGKQKKCHW
jgi:hypothetical protein